MYEGHENQGMRCIREILNEYAERHGLDMNWDEFEVRLKNATPAIDQYDIFISTGGPGSPLDSIGSEWEKVYFNWLQQIEEWNDNSSNDIKKHVFFICHSFQLACRHYALGNVCKRKSTAFGVFPIHMLDNGMEEPVFRGLKNPFYAVDSRDYQVIEPNWKKLDEMGAAVLCIEKERPHVPYERAVMGIRFNEYMIGTQFHPEADAPGMSMYLLRADKKKTVIENHGEEKWHNMIEQLNDPHKIMKTYSHILPNFLNIAVEHMQEASVSL
jgi:GMP synthase-like glutamine amidotransferase